MKELLLILVIVLFIVAAIMFGISPRDVMDTNPETETVVEPRQLRDPYAAAHYKKRVKFAPRNEVRYYIKNSNTNELLLTSPQLRS